MIKAWRLRSAIISFWKLPSLTNVGLFDEKPTCNLMLWGFMLFDACSSDPKSGVCLSAPSWGGLPNVHNTAERVRRVWRMRPLSQHFTQISSSDSSYSIAPLGPHLLFLKVFWCVQGQFKESVKQVFVVFALTLSWHVFFFVKWISSVSVLPDYSVWFWHTHECTQLAFEEPLIGKNILM